MQNGIIFFFLFSFYMFCHAVFVMLIYDAFELLRPSPIRFKIFFYNKRTIRLIVLSFWRRRARTEKNWEKGKKKTQNKQSVH